jgi:hypothetical protein
MTIYEICHAALSPLGLPLAAVMMKPGKGQTYPDRYLVYQLISAPPEAHADDLETERTYLVQVNAWSRNGFIGFPDIEAAMLAAGFRYSSQRDLPFSTETGHSGLSLDFFYLENRS